MKQLLIEVPDHLAELLERFAPAKSRKRSEFVRMALWKAVWTEQEKETSESYRRMPASEGEGFLEAESAEPENDWSREAKAAGLGRKAGPRRASSRSRSGSTRRSGTGR